MKDPNEYNVRAVERALQILECFDNDHPERGISEIAEAVGLHKATAHRIVTTLLNHGYLERSEDGQRYRLGLELSTLGYKVIHRMDLRREALPFMRKMVNEWDETCDLSVFDRGMIFYVEVLRSNRALNVAAAVGQRLPAHATASGKVFLAHLPSHELNLILNQPLKAFTKNTLTSVENLGKELEKVRSQGYAVDIEEFEEGIYAIAVPIYNRQGQVIAAIGGPTPISRMTTERIGEIAAGYIGIAKAISHRMGWNRT